MTNETPGTLASKVERPQLRHAAKFFLALALLIPVLPFTALSTRADVVPPKPILAHAEAAIQTVYKSYLPTTNIGLPPVSPKKGLAWTYGVCDDLTTTRVAWTYQWYPNPPRCNQNVEIVPMIRDATQWANFDSIGLGGSSQWLLGFNEPDLCPEQACLTPAQAVPLWHGIETRFPNRKLVAPVPSHLHPDWLVQFRNNYIATYGTPPRFNALAAHWYGFKYADAKALLDWYKARATEFGVAEIWLTEFAFPVLDHSTCGGVAQSDAMNEAQRLIANLDTDAMITRYAWYAPRIDTSDPLQTGGTTPECNAPLLDLTGKTLTNWGMMYRAH